MDYDFEGEVELPMDTGEGATPMDIGAAIKKQITENLKNFDIVSVIQKIVASTPEDEENDDVREKLQEVLQKYNDMSEEEKESFTNQMKEMLANKVSMKFDNQEFKLDGLQEAIGQAVAYRLAFVAFGILVLIFIFVFFGYKLYKSIKEKEIKREEKKKAKQMKKKK